MLRTTVRQVDKVLTVALADAKTHKLVERITATREHPFYVRRKGFTPAGGLAVGNTIVTRAGPALVVQSVTWRRRAEGYTVHNFVVEDDHSYFVGTHGGGAWVHNGGPNCWNEFQSATQGMFNDSTEAAGVFGDVKDVLARIRTGSPHPFLRDGITFENRQGLLPTQVLGYYSEYTVRTPGIATRGARRIVLGNGGEVYFTPDHYHTFVRLSGL